MLPTSIILTLLNSIRCLQNVHPTVERSAMTDAATQARADQDQIVSNKEYVREQRQK